MAQEPTIKIQFFASGYCEAHATVVNPIEGKGKSVFYAVWALVQVPEVGYVLFDTGYNHDFQTATKSFPGRLYRMFTPVHLNASQTAKAILEKQGISADEIKYIIISHFHADHVCALKNFPNAQFICTKNAYEEAINLKGIKAVSKGILPDLIPNDFKERTLLIEDFADAIETNNADLIEYKIFGNNNFKLILLPGHAKGMLGFIYKNESEHILYATDASWNYDTFFKGILPRKIVKIFFDSWTDYVESQQKLKAYELIHKDCTILFTHCPKTLDYISNEI